MKMVRIGKNLVHEVPETWVEGEKILSYAYAARTGRGSNLALQAACARVAFGLLCDQSMTPDPTEALLRLMQRICKRKGAGLEPQPPSKDQGAR